MLGKTLEEKSISRLAEESEKFSLSDDEEAKLSHLNPKPEINVSPWNFEITHYGNHLTIPHEPIGEKPKTTIVRIRQHTSFKSTDLTSDHTMTIKRQNKTPEQRRSSCYYTHDDFKTEENKALNLHPIHINSVRRIKEPILVPRREELLLAHRIEEQMLFPHKETIVVKPRSYTVEIPDKPDFENEDQFIENKEKIDKITHFRKISASLPSSRGRIEKNKPTIKVNSVIPNNLPKIKTSNKSENLTPLKDLEKLSKRSQLIELLKNLAPKLLIPPAQNSARSKSSGRRLENTSQNPKDRSSSGQLHLNKLEICPWKDSIIS
ncbi:unnamed protein product [Blepharisma stoltei]|uniref:Uncharacterized protein n=1 Tax=Blepharisma stoltei TaxID=1481888 RepID=A0AAU9K6K4_9CILI|nr:unnamed protein product [Blepharisma stoltei]